LPDGAPLFLACVQLGNPEELMKHQRQFATESGIASKEAAEEIRMLITDLVDTVQTLDANIAAEEERARVPNDGSHRVSDACEFVRSNSLVNHQDSRF
jgi:hypothetical protein